MDNKEEKFLIAISNNESEVEGPPKNTESDKSFARSGDESEGYIAASKQVGVSDNKSKNKSKIIFSKFNLQPKKKNPVKKANQNAQINYSSIQHDSQLLTLLEDVVI